MSEIHATAIVEDGAVLGEGVRIGPHCIVGSHVTLGDGVILESHVVINGRTSIGDRTVLSPFAAIGGAPQDISYRGEDTELEIGPDCVIREQVTIHRGTASGRGKTSIGARCYLMIGAHVAHDCVLGEEVILTNQATIGGHSILEDHVILGGLSGVKQNLRVGAHAFISGFTGVTRDIIPYSASVGQPAELTGLNVVGLKRRGFDKEQIHRLRSAYRQFFTSVGPRKDRLAALRETLAGDEAVTYLVAFLEAGGDRPLALPRKGLNEEEA